MTSFSASRVGKEYAEFAIPESELRQIFAANPDDLSADILSQTGTDAMFVGLGRANAPHSRAGAGVFDLPLPLKIRSDCTNHRPSRRNPGVKYGLDLARFARQKDALKRGVPGARIIELVGATTYIFLSNETDVIRELRTFVTELPR
jgi:hypothetical protein